jgi:regulator of protease activity HflC (stomatin/prohibitin superfamily)
MEENNIGRIFRIIGLSGLALVIFIWLCSGPISFINPGKRGVEVIQGRVTGRIYTEGWYAYNSLIKEIVQFDTKTQLETVKVSAASQDLQDVNVEVAVQYRLDSNKVADILRTIGSQSDVKEKIIDPALQETVKASTALFPVAEIIKQRPAVKDKIEEFLTNRLMAYGVLLEELSIKDIVFSEQFTKAIEEKQVAEQNKIKSEFEAQSVVAKAEGKAQEQQLLRESLTPELLQRLWIEKWNGTVP